jgi:hypothetical protein
MFGQMARDFGVDILPLGDDVLVSQWVHLGGTVRENMKKRGRREK